jgi:hypothetical protein
MVSEWTTGFLRFTSKFVNFVEPMAARFLPQRVMNTKRSRQLCSVSIRGQLAGQ